MSSIGTVRIRPIPRRRPASARAMSMTKRPASRRARARSFSSVAPVMSAEQRQSVSSGRSAIDSSTADFVEDAQLGRHGVEVLVPSQLTA